MKRSLQNSTGLRATFYTHPLCKASWEMHQDWLAFYDAYHHMLAIKFCLGERAVEDEQEGKAYKSPHLSLAVKAASLQSEHAAHLFLAALREAVWLQNADTSSLNLPVIVARRVSKQNQSHLDFNRFVNEITSRQTARALNEDLNKFHVNRIHTIPTITLTWNGRGLKLEGKQTCLQLVNALKQLMPSGIPNSHALGQTAVGKGSYL